MWGGRHGFKVRNFDILQLFAIAAGIAYNLRRQGRFPPDHGTDDCNDESVLVVPEPHAVALARTSPPANVSATASTRPPARPTTTPPPPATSPPEPTTDPPPG